MKFYISSFSNYLIYLNLFLILNFHYSPEWIQSSLKFTDHYTNSKYSKMTRVHNYSYMSPINVLCKLCVYLCWIYILPTYNHKFHGFSQGEGKIKYTNCSLTTWLFSRLLTQAIYSLSFVFVFFFSLLFSW